MLTITFWQVALIFIIVRGVLFGWLRDGETKDGDGASRVFGASLVTTFVLYMGNFFSLLYTPQIIYLSIVSILWLLLIFYFTMKTFYPEKVTVSKNKSYNCVDFSKELTGKFLFTTLVYYGGFFSTISFN